MRHLLICLFLGLSLTVQAAEIEPVQLLKKSDQARGGGLPGLSWEIRSQNSGSRVSEDDPPMRLLIKASDHASLAETLEPLRSKGARMLQVERNMWLTKPGLKKPIPISPRQRLTGQAAIGDIAATNYVRDYTPTLLREEKINGETCYLLELTATSRQATYDKLRYWISASSNLGVQAEFNSLSGKKLKSAVFEYGNRVNVQGRVIPFVSRMVISDALTDAKTTLDYSHITVKPIAPSEFDPGNLE